MRNFYPAFPICDALRRELSWTNYRIQGRIDDDERRLRNYHLPDVRKVIEAGKSAQQEMDEILLTRYAYYLIAQNGDSRKPEIAFAQDYFAVQTRRAELVERRLLKFERVKAREKLSLTESHLSGVLYERGADSQGFAIIRSKGDHVLFGLNTMNCLQYRRSLIRTQ